MDRDINQEPEYQALVNLLENMEPERVALLKRILVKLDREERYSDYYTTGQAAEKLGLTTAGVRLWLETGKLKGHMVGKRWRVDRKSVDAMLEG